MSCPSADVPVLRSHCPRETPRSERHSEEVTHRDCQRDSCGKHPGTAVEHLAPQRCTRTKQGDRSPGQAGAEDHAGAAATCDSHEHADPNTCERENERRPDEVPPERVTSPQRAGCQQRHPEGTWRNGAAHRTDAGKHDKGTPDSNRGELPAVATCNILPEPIGHRGRSCCDDERPGNGKHRCDGREGQRIEQVSTVAAAPSRSTGTEPLAHPAEQRTRCDRVHAPVAPSCTVRAPESRTSSLLCVAMSTAVPAAARSRRIAANTARRSASSRCSGSSSTSTVLGRISVRHSANNCCCPEESSCGNRFTSAPSPIWSRMSTARAAALAAESFHESATSSRCSQSVRSLASGGEPMSAASALRKLASRGCGAWPCTANAPSERGTSPAQARSRVVFPEPFGPRTATISPAKTLQVVGGSNTSLSIATVAARARSDGGGAA